MFTSKSPTQGWYFSISRYCKNICSTVSSKIISCSCCSIRDFSIKCLSYRNSICGRSCYDKGIKIQTDLKWVLWVFILFKFEQLLFCRIFKHTWQILSLHLQICPTQAPSTAPDTSKYVQFSFDELPQPVATESKKKTFHMDYTLPWPPHSRPHNISAFNIWAL